MGDGLGAVLESFLECSLCHEQYENPKMLKCTHVFCKDCLEEIVQFEDDGSTVIVCPYACHEQTLLLPNQTVNQLPSSFNLRNILEALKAKNNALSERKMPNCAFRDNCARNISVFCCDSMMCSICYDDHLNGGMEHKKRDILLTKGKKVGIVCDEHASICTHICEYDLQLLCQYCINRNKRYTSRSHRMIKTEADTVKDMLLRVLNNQGNLNSQVSENIDNLKQKIRRSLELRKEECLSLYKRLLDADEGRILKEVEDICSIEMEGSTSTISSQSMSRLLQKQDVELALQKEPLISNLTKSKMNGSRKVDVSLTQTYNFLSLQPLGGVEETQCAASSQLSLSQEDKNITDDPRDCKVVESHDMGDDLVNGNGGVESEETDSVITGGNDSCSVTEENEDSMSVCSSTGNSDIILPRKGHSPWKEEKTKKEIRSTLSKQSRSGRQKRNNQNRQSSNANHAATNEDLKSGLPEKKSGLACNDGLTSDENEWDTLSKLCPEANRKFTMCVEEIGPSKVGTPLQKKSILSHFASYNVYHEIRVKSNAVFVSFPSLFTAYRAWKEKHNSLMFGRRISVQPACGDLTSLKAAVFKVIVLDFPIGIVMSTFVTKFAKFSALACVDVQLSEKRATISYMNKESAQRACREVINVKVDGTYFTLKVKPVDENLLVDEDEKPATNGHLGEDERQSALVEESNHADHERNMAKNNTGVKSVKETARRLKGRTYSF